MSWEDILKGGEEYRLYSLIERDMAGLIKEIKSGKVSPQFIENILQPIYEIMGGLKSASMDKGGNFSNLHSELKNHLRQNISPLNRNLAERISRSAYLS